MYFLKRSRSKFVTKILLFIFVLEPVFLLATVTPVHAQSSGNGSYNQTFGNDQGISQWGNLDVVNNPAIGSALKSCLQVVPGFTKKIKKVFGNTGKTSAGSSLTKFSGDRSTNIKSFCSIVNTNKWATVTVDEMSGYSTEDILKACQEEEDTSQAEASKLSGLDSSSDSVPTEDKVAAKKLDELLAKQRLLVDDVQKTKDEAVKTNKVLDETKVREECMDSIAYSMTKTLLAGVTEGTVNMINTGNFGDPFFLKDTKSYFQGIDNLSIKQVFGGLVDSLNQTNSNYPYLRSTYKNLIDQNVPIDFRDRAKFTLEQVLSTQPYNKSSDPSSNQLVNSFKNDFSVGGWKGWVALTQSPQNNPIGFAILAQEELTKTQTAAKDAAKSELDQSGGYLSMRRCIEEYVPESKDAKGNVVAGFTRTRGVKVGPNDENCKKSEVTSPGSVLATRLNAVISTDVRQLELADRFNQSLNLIFSTAFNKLTSEGLSSLSNKVYGSWSSQARKESFVERYNNSVNAANNGSVSKTSLGTAELIYRRAESSYSSYDFDITTDLFDQTIGCTSRPGILNTEKNYLKELENSSNPKISPLYKLMPAMAELDFCIPGPTTNWEEITDEKYIDLVDKIETEGIGFNPDNPVPGSFYSEIGAQIGEIERKLFNRDLARTATQSTIIGAGAVLAIYTYGISAAVAGIINGIISIYANRDKKKTQDEINQLNDAADALNYAIPVAFEKEGNEWAKLQLSYLKEDYTDYKEAIYDKFSDDKNIPVAKEARNFVKDLPSYAQNLYTIQDSYTEELKTAREVVAELQIIHDRVKVINDSARARAKTNGIDLTVPIECRPAANQCPKTIKIGNYIITQDPTAYSTAVNQNLTVDPSKFIAVSSNGGASGYTALAPSQLSTASNALFMSADGKSFGGGYKFGKPTVEIEFSGSKTTNSSSSYRGTFTIKTNDTAFSVLVDAPFEMYDSTSGYSGKEVYGQNVFPTLDGSISDFIGADSSGKVFKVTVSNPNGEKATASCTVKKVNSRDLVCN